jgi:hypothetical protein
MNGENNIDRKVREGRDTMEKVCPACNKLTSMNINCSSCCKDMTDSGRAQELLQDDYTANMPINDASNYCVHVFKCDACKNSQNIRVSKIVVGI